MLDPMVKYRNNKSTIPLEVMDMNQQNYLDWNVIETEEFRGEARQVFEQVSKALAKTLGPYGANTIIEQYGQMHVTKDGWQILKNLRFDSNRHNNILILLTNICAQVVNKVGDGSTSSIVAANQILKELENLEPLKAIRSKDLQDRLLKIAGILGKVIINNASLIDPEQDPTFQDIYRLAMISTNGDSQISEFLRAIYAETMNPAVDFVKSPTNKASYEIIEGYEGPISLLDQVYATNAEEATCEIKNPLILMFDHQVTLHTHFPKLIQPAAEYAMQQKRRLVVVAPHYDQFMLDTLSRMVNAELQGRGTTSVVYTVASIVNNNSRDIYNDFAVMAGAEIISEILVSDITDEEAETRPNIVDYIGAVEHIKISPKGKFNTLIKGFTNRNEAMYEVCVNDATAKYKKAEERNLELNMVGTEVFILKRRMYKLKGKMGVIYVGGSSNLEKESNFDLVEDAVKACESAFYYGYNLGGNMAVTIAAHEVMLTEELDKVDQEIIKAIVKAFQSVFAQVIRNRDVNATDEEIEKIIDNSVDNGMCFDLINNVNNPDIINPCYTDVEILKAAVSIVGILLTSNQYVAIKYTAQQ